MLLYADSTTRRARQLLGDVLLIGWVLAWLWVSSVVHDATMALAEPGQRISEAGAGMADQLRDAGATVGDVPLVGDEVRDPFDGAGDAADRIAGAGDAQVAAVTDLAFWLALVVGAVPILVALAAYLPLRWRFVREAGAAQRLLDSGGDLDLFALRAIVRQPVHRLARVSDDPSGAWKRGDDAVVRALAEMELSDAGLSLPR